MIVETRGLTVRFSRGPFRKRSVAVDALDLSIREGDFFALLGPNGAGKSTAMHCMLGLLRPTAGEVRVMGAPVQWGSPILRGLAYLPEEPRYPEYLTVQEAVTYYARLSGVAASAARAADVIDRLGLGEHRRLTIRRCSKGMKQKVGIAQCLVHEPRLLFLDEPMRGLDPMTVHLFREILIDMNRKGATIVMNSHLLTEVELVANRVAVLNKGRLVAQEDVASLVRSEENDYTVEIVGRDAPSTMRDTVEAGPNVRGVVKRSDLYDFMDEARARQLQIVACELNKTRLEDRVLGLLRQEQSHA